jgi:putative SOS response-associated peptidase YedK
MPAIIERKDYVRWLDAGDVAPVAAELLRPLAVEQVRAWPVSDRVGNTRNNDASLLDPVSKPDEPTQGELF